MSDYDPYHDAENWGAMEQRPTLIEHRNAMTDEEAELLQCPAELRELPHKLGNITHLDKVFFAYWIFPTVIGGQDFCVRCDYSGDKGIPEWTVDATKEPLTREQAIAAILEAWRVSEPVREKRAKTFRTRVIPTVRP